MDEQGASESPDIRAFAGSVGVLIDRVAPSGQEVLASVWLLEEDRVATLGHIVAPYAKQLEALKVIFPSTDEQWGVSKVLFHPRFNKKRSTRLIRQTVSDAQPALTLQKHNGAVLTLCELNPLSDGEKQAINKALTLPPQQGQGLSGNLEEIDLALVIQTITNARKEGTIVISDERYRPVARLFCRNGKVLYAAFKNLVNEYAIYQIFEQPLTGHFVFQSANEPDWPVQRPITRPIDMLLIESHRRLDELKRMVSALGGRQTIYCHAVDHPDIGILPLETRETASDLWQFIDGATPMGRLWQVANVDDYSVFQCALEMFKTRQIENIDEMGEFLTVERVLKQHLGQQKREPLPIAVASPLAPKDRILSLSTELATGRPRLREGLLLGALRQGDPWHLIHNIRVLPEAAGSPLFKDGCVIGMHCGNLPAQPDAGEPEGKLQQMLWVESVMECLKEGLEPEFASKLSSVGQEMVRRFSGSGPLPNPLGKRRDLPGCREVARIDCAKCGATSLESARFCKICGQRLIGELEPRHRRTMLNPLAALAVVLLVGFTASAAMFFMRLPVKPNLVGSASVLLPDQPWLKLSVNRYQENKNIWAPVPYATRLKKSDHIYLGANVLEPCHIYILERQNTSNDGSLIYKGDGVKDIRLDAGSKIAYPPDYQVTTDGEHYQIAGMQFGGPEGTDMVIAIASHEPLDLSNPAVAGEVFQSALALLDQADLPDGIEVDPKSLSPKLLPTGETGNSQSAPIVYLTRLPIDHGND